MKREKSGETREKMASWDSVNSVKGDASIAAAANQHNYFEPHHITLQFFDVLMDCIFYLYIKF